MIFVQKVLQTLMNSVFSSSVKANTTEVNLRLPEQMFYQTDWRKLWFKKQELASFVYLLAYESNSTWSARLFSKSVHYIQAVCQSSSHNADLSWRRPENSRCIS